MGPGPGLSGGGGSQGMLETCDSKPAEAHEKHPCEMGGRVRREALRHFSDRDERKVPAPGGVLHVEIHASTGASTDERMRPGARRLPRQSRSRLVPRRSARGTPVEANLIGSPRGEGFMR